MWVYFESEILEDCPLKERIQYKEKQTVEIKGLASSQDLQEKCGPYL